jgi:hypothetical protein
VSLFDKKRDKEEEEEQEKEKEEKKNIFTWWRPPGVIRWLRHSSSITALLWKEKNYEW